MKVRTIVMLSLAAAVAVAAPSAASAAAEDTGWYLGVSGGTTSNGDYLGSNDDGSLSGISEDDGDTGFKVFGGYRFLPWLGVEAAYTDLGSSSFTATSAGGESWAPGQVSAEGEADGYELDARARWPVSDHWALVGKLGWYSWDSHETFVENGFVSTDEDSGSDATFGVGVEWDPGEKEKVVWRADAERYQADDDGNDIDALSVGFSWQF